MTRIIAHLDMDSFFASAECLRHPELTGQPLVVGADPKGGTGRGVVATCSYAARGYGIRSGMPVSTAYHLCPDAVFIRPEHQFYKTISDQVMELLRQAAPLIQQVSIDEAYLDISFLESYERAGTYAQNLKNTIHEATGLSCSVGIAPNKMTAKIASDLEKPDGLTIIQPEDCERILHPLPAGRIPGIGKKSGPLLATQGINTIGDIATTDIQRLQDLLGSRAVRIKKTSQGAYDSPLVPQREPKSIGNETTFEQDTTDIAIIEAALNKLTTKVQGRLKSAGYRCRTLTIKIRYEGFITRTKVITLPHPTVENDQIASAAQNLFFSSLEEKPVRLIGITAGGLTQTAATQTTLDDF